MIIETKNFNVAIAEDGDPVSVEPGTVTVSIRDGYKMSWIECLSIYMDAIHEPERIKDYDAISGTLVWPNQDGSIGVYPVGD